MLRAILHGKAGRIGGSPVDAGHSWRDLFREREDLLTAVFFGRLRYLSPAALDAVMRGLLVRVGPESEGLGALREVRFWSKLRATSGRRYVEPDVLLAFEHANLIVEVKPDHARQSVEQWRAEVAAWRDARRIDDADADSEPPDAAAAGDDADDGATLDPLRPLHFLALGGNTAQTRAALEPFAAEFGALNVIAHAIDWSEVVALIEVVGQTASGADAAVCEDWMEAFALFGLHRSVKPWAPLLTFRAVLTADWSRRLPALATSARKASTSAQVADRAADWSALRPFLTIHSKQGTRWL